MKIAPTQVNFPPGGPAPAFVVRTDGERWYAVQVSTDASLLNAALAGRRTPETFWDSRLGDDAWPGTVAARLRTRVPGRPGQAPTGRSTYQLPDAVWRRFRPNGRLYFRLLVGREPSLAMARASVADVDCGRAPAVSVATAPAQPTRAAVARFRGSGVLSRGDLLGLARREVDRRGLLIGRDGDFSFAFLKADRYRMVVIECHEEGLTDTVSAMPRKPAAVINGQFIASPFGIATEGQVIREQAVIWSDSQPSRWEIAQDDEPSARFSVRQGNPTIVEPQARVAFGGLVPVLSAGKPPASLTQWARSIFDKPRDTGRGVVALHRQQGLLLLLVQRNIPPWSPTANAMTLKEIQTALQGLGFTDAVANDGSDSEALFAGSGWLVEPAFRKDEVMDFAIGFVDRTVTRRSAILVVDGTASADGQAVAKQFSRPATTAYVPRPLATEIVTEPATASLAPVAAGGVLQVDRVGDGGRQALVRSVIRNGGSPSRRADLMYVSSHATRHGVLYYNPRSAPTTQVPLADLWHGFAPSWESLRWLVLAGCSVLGLRVSVGKQLVPAERSRLQTLHSDIHNTATVPGLTAATRTVFAAYHPGWVWYDKVFRTLPNLRGVLGYSYRSPGEKTGDVDIVTAFAKKLSAGEAFLAAWQSANERGLLADAAWAAMVRKDCTDDRLGHLEAVKLPAPRGGWNYYDAYQTGATIEASYATANRLGGRRTIGTVTLSVNDEYDRLALEELATLPLSGPTHLTYDDGLGPPVPPRRPGGRGAR